jgi:ribosome biogenesis GTPase / thiamine phosphate phosphatase
MTPETPEPRKGRQRKRIDLRKNRAPAARRKGWTNLYRQGRDQKLDEQTQSVQRVGKNDLTRRRTTIESEPGLPGSSDAPVRVGRVLLMRGHFVEVDIDGQPRRCVVRGMLRKRLRDEHNPVTVGDEVEVSAVESTGPGQDRPEGIIEALLPRRGVLARHHDDRLQAIAANVDQAVIVSAIQMPEIRPHLIDRYIVAAEAGNIRPVICVNKADLDPEDFCNEFLDVYRKIGYAGVRTSVVRAEGIDDLRAILKDKASVIVGMSGVGKSSLLNAVQPGLGLKIGDINIVLKRGRHTTTAAQLLKLDFGGYVVDTPGIRQLELPDVDRGDLEMYFVEFVPLVAGCKFANCAHVREDGCAIKQAVEQGRIDPERYESYVRMWTGETKGE